MDTVASRPAPGNADVLIPDEVAELLRIPRRRVLGMAARGEIPAFRLGKDYRFDASKIRALIAAGEATEG